jgi:hypothetical protein
MAAAKGAGAHRIGAIAERFESGGRGPGTVSSGAGDPGGISYGTYQLASRTGTLGGWRFADMPAGANVLVRAGGGVWRRGAGGWQAPTSILAAVGGATVDTECRASVSALISALAAQGLIVAG